MGFQLLLAAMTTRQAALLVVVVLVLLVCLRQSFVAVEVVPGQVSHLTCVRGGDD